MRGYVYCILGVLFGLLVLLQAGCADRGSNYYGYPSYQYYNDYWYRYPAGRYYNYPDYWGSYHSRRHRYYYEQDDRDDDFNHPEPPPVSKPPRFKPPWPKGKVNQPDQNRPILR